MVEAARGFRFIHGFVEGVGELGLFAFEAIEFKGELDESDGGAAAIADGGHVAVDDGVERLEDGGGEFGRNWKGRRRHGGGIKGSWDRGVGRRAEC